MLEISESSVIYQAKTKLLDLAFEVASIRNYKKESAQIKIRSGFSIYKSLQALDFGVYLNQEQRQKIVYCLIRQAGINDFPVAPSLGNTEPPTIQVGIPGPPGGTGARGEDGGATDFGFINQGTDSVADSFSVSDAYAARWDYVVYDSGGSRRSGTITCDWSTDGSSVSDPAELSGAGSGDTEDIQFSVDYYLGNIRLLAIITDGIWTVQGSRYFIPNNGTGTGVINTTLTDGNIFVGNASNVAVAVLPSGAVSVTNTGVFSLTPGVIVNATINASASIAFSKMAALTATKVAITDGSGVITTSSITPTELSYLSGATSNIQTQLDSKIGSVTGAISTVVSSNLTADRALVSNPSGKIAISGTTSTELGYVSGVTSAIQTQLGSKVNDTGDTMTGALINTTTIEAQGGWRTQTTGPYFKFSELTPFTWNMDSTANVSIAHGLSAGKLLLVSVRLVSGGGIEYVLPIFDQTTGLVQAGVSSTSSGFITVARLIGGLFDNATWNNTTITVSILHEA